MLRLRKPAKFDRGGEPAGIIPEIDRFQALPRRQSIASLLSRAADRHDFGLTCMITRIRDCTPLLREAIAEARAAGFEKTANDLEQVAVAAFTTSSEMLLQHGLAIKRFLKATHDTLPRSTKAKLKACLTETELGCAGWRKLMALMKRSRALS